MLNATKNNNIPRTSYMYSTWDEGGSSSNIELERGYGTDLVKRRTQAGRVHICIRRRDIPAIAWHPFPGRNEFHANKVLKVVRVLTSTGLQWVATRRMQTGAYGRKNVQQVTRQRYASYTRELQCKHGKIDERRMLCNAPWRIWNAITCVHVACPPVRG